MIKNKLNKNIKQQNAIFRYGHSDNRFESGSDFSDFGYFEIREIGTVRII